MTRDITISIAEDLIETAQNRARAEGTTVDDLIRRWLTDYAQRQQRVDAAMQVIQDLRTKIGTGGRRLTRDEMNER
ncbi:conserved hypothetical protein [Thiocapsa sp. KS1]|jgi:hypothetical protein|nr:hypothetical protein [Thiocapsa sp. KS1]CRI65849.1 conserved hypothetical protein [Thiocapsa sp. KS1]